MKISEIRDRTDEELETLAGQLRDDLYGLRVQKATNQLDNTDSLRIMRREIARVRTVQHARNLDIEQPNRSSDQAAEGQE